MAVSGHIFSREWGRGSATGTWWAEAKMLPNIHSPATKNDLVHVSSTMTEEPRFGPFGAVCAHVCLVRQGPHRLSPAPAAFIAVKMATFSWVQAGCQASYLHDFTYSL